MLTNALVTLGDNFTIIVIGCLEIIAAIVLIIKACSNSYGKKKISVSNKTEDVFLNELNNVENKAFILVRNKDKMPVYATGNLSKFFSTDLKGLQEDTTKLVSNVADNTIARKAFLNYQKWDGKGSFSDVWPMNNGYWLFININKSDNGAYDLIDVLDISDFHSRELDYKSKLEAAKDESEAKTSFLSRMSHEIRTPLNGIMGTISLIENNLDDKKAIKEYLNKSKELSNHLLSLINDILDMSRIEAGKIELENEPFSIKNLGDKLYEMFIKEAEQKGLEYRVDFVDLSVDNVIGDELRISQILINFLSNAFKFTKEGQVIVTFKQMMLKKDTVDFMFRVHDTGKGMESSFINKIFRPFEQEDVGISKKYGGTGLGMAITDRLVRLMGGEIVVESALDKGSDFSVYLSFKLANKEATSPELVGDSNNDYKDAFVGKRILLAEDNDINALISTEMLKTMGAIVDRVEDGLAAVQLFDKHEIDYYDFILMDVQMPVLDGRKATKRIRDLKRNDAKTILIYALSADAFVEDERLSIEAGMNGHFSKPIDFDNLRIEIGKDLSKRGQR